MNPYILLVFSVLFAASNNLLLHRFGNRGLDGARGLFLFNSLVSVVWSVLLFGYGIISGTLGLHPEAMLWGIAYGTVTALFLLCKMQAMSTGPVSLTSFIGCASLLVSTGFGVVVLHEGASVIQMTGVLTLIIALFLVISPKGGKADKKWMIWCAAFFMCSAAVGIIFKLFGRSAQAEKVDTMMLTAAVWSAVLFAAGAIAAAVSGRGKRGRDGPETKFIFPREAIIYVLACGVVSCLYNRLNISLAGMLPSVVFFPVFNGSVILISTLAGVFAFREKLRGCQIVGISVGVFALILTSGSADTIISQLFLKG